MNNPAFAVDAYRLIRRLLMVSLPKESFPNLNRAEFVDFYLRGAPARRDGTRLGDMVRNIAKGLGMPERELMGYGESDWAEIAAYLAGCVDTEVPLPEAESWGHWPDGWQESHRRSKRSSPAPEPFTAAEPQAEPEPDRLTAGYTDDGGFDEIDADKLF